MSNVILPVRVGLAGFYRLQVGKPGHKPRVDTGWFPNVITDQGLEFLGNTGGYLTACQVGTGNAVPAFTDTGLANYLVGTITLQSTTLSAQASPPYYAARTNTYRFAAGVAAGNLSEVGVGTAASGSTLFSRALILDGAGNPTTITVLSDEVLDVTYQLRIIPRTDDVTVDVTDNGPAGTVHTFTIRAAKVTFATDNSSGWGTKSNGTSMGDTLSGPLTAYNGSIGAITGGPSGDFDQVTGTAVTPYTAGSLERVYTHSFGLNDGNLSGGISAIQFNFARGAGGTWQAGISPPIPKTADKTLSITTKVSWFRETI